MNTQIFLLAAGAGSRFIAGGYSLPKPLIRVKDLAMWEYVTRAMCLTDVYGIFSTEAADRLCPKPPYCYQLRELTRGPVESALLGLQLAGADVDLEAPVMFYDCDSYVDAALQNIACYFELSQAHAGIVGFTGPASESDDNKAKLICTDDLTLLLQAYERAPEHHIQGNVLGACGIYWFSSGFEFERRAKEFLQRRRHGNSEPTFAKLLADSGEDAAQVMAIPRENFHCLGTPEELSAYLSINT